MEDNKSIKKTIRFDEKTINELNIILKKYNIDTFSEGIRFLVNHYNDQNNNGISIAHVCNLNTKFNVFMDKYNVEEYDRDSLKKEIDKLWTI